MLIIILCHWIALQTRLPLTIFYMLILTSLCFGQAKRTTSASEHKVGYAGRNITQSKTKPSLPKTPKPLEDTPFTRRLKNVEKTDPETAREMKQVGDDMRHEAEVKMKGWKRSQQNDQIPPPELQYLSTKVEGVWSYSTGFDSTTLHVLPFKGQRLLIYLETGGCVGRYELKRTGQYANGVLTLNKPVKTYMGLIYDRLYVLHVGEGYYLVPDLCINDFQQAVSSDGKRLNKNMHCYKFQSQR